MRMQFNFDEDIMTELATELEPEGEWFKNLPVMVQLRKLWPYMEKQNRRDTRRIKVMAA